MRIAAKILSAGCYKERVGNMKLTPNFYLSELIESDYAERHGIKNIPGPAVQQNLMVLASGLECVRAILGAPLTIISGYRNTELNRGIGGVSTSAHLTGFAADFKSRAFGTPKAIVEKIKNSGIKYDQLIGEGSWVHISFDPKMRQQTMSAIFKNGKAVYSEA